MAKVEMQTQPQTVRHLSEDDLGAVRSLLDASSLPTVGVDMSLPIVYGVFRGDRLVGCAAIERHGRFGLLRSVAVAEDVRGAGIGSVLVDTIVAAARDADIDALYLLTENAERFFATKGFARTERAGVPPVVLASDEFREICPSTAIAMVRAFA